MVIVATFWTDFQASVGDAMGQLDQACEMTRLLK